MAASVGAKTKRLGSFLKKSHRELFEVHARPSDWTVLERMISVVLQGTDPLKKSERAVSVLRETYRNWNEVRVARQYELRDLFAQKRVTHVVERALIVQEFLRRIFGMQNHLELDWMLDATSERRQKLIDALDMEIPCLAALLDLDAMEEGDLVPMGPDLKRLCSRLGLTQPNPKESVVRELLEPLLEKDALYGNFAALRVLADLGCDPKHPKGKPARLLHEAWSDKSPRATVAFDGILTELGMPAKKVPAKKKAAKKKVSKKTVVKKKTAKKAAKKKVVKKTTSKKAKG